MKSWSITQARARIADVVDAALSTGPQKIERRDSEPVIVISESIWKRIVADYPSFADLVLNAPLDDEDLPVRRPARVLANMTDD